jgi:heptosyltransferase-3
VNRTTRNDGQIAAAGGARMLSRVLEVGLGRLLYGGEDRPPGTLRPDRVVRILVVRKDNIGDVICTTPAIRALRRAFPQARLAFLVAEHCRAAVERNPDVDAVYTYVKSKHRSGLARLRALWDLARLLQDLRRQRFDLAVAFGRPCSRSNAWLAYAARTTWRLGYRSHALSPFPFFLNLGHEPGVGDTHEVDACLSLLEQIGVRTAGRELTLAPDPDTQAAVRDRLREAGHVEGAGLALVHISSRREANRWPAAHFACAADALRERLGLSIVLSWAPGDSSNPLFPGDDDKAEEVARQMRVRPILLRTPTLRELIAAISLGEFVLSSDGGPVHLTAALGVPQVALFGQAGQVHWAPVSEKSVVLQRDNRVDRISVEEVVEAATAVMARWGRGVAGVRPDAAKR